MDDVDQNTPYEDYSPNERDTDNEGSPREVHNDDPHTPSRPEAPGSLTGRMFSAVASGFQGLVGGSSASAAKRVGDQGRSGGAFDNMPVPMSASATPMMSGPGREGTPGAGGFLGASDETPAPNTNGSSQSAVQWEHTGNAASRQKRWRKQASAQGGAARRQLERARRALV